MWQQQVRTSFKKSSEFNKYLDSEKCVDNNFSLKIPKEFAKLINKNNINDVILKQFLPTNKEDDDFLLSPLADEDHMPIAGLVHKYYNRALLITTQSCFVHCRYCFRKNFTYTNNDIFNNFKAVIGYLKEHQEIDEIILSGGDPLSLSDKKLKVIIAKIAKIKHIKTLRIHTRNLVILPTRITTEFINILKNSKINIVIVFHINHYQEISDDFKIQLKKLKKLNITLLNQSVLLKGINDNSKTLVELSNILFSLGILPYYLHLLDKVNGSKQFIIDDKKAQIIYAEMQEKLSGYLLPKLVRDENNSSKNLIS